MTQNAETPLRLTGASREDSAAGGKSAAIVPQLSDDAQQGADVDCDVLTDLWANAKIAWAARDFPKYGSRAWIALEPGDPRRLAGALEAAEMWRKYGDEEELCAWLRNLGRSVNLTGYRTRAELDELALPKPAHQLRATPGWPPIRVPGQPGRYITHTEGRKAA
jgi:hypothetical protein